ncbi:DUF402 domain-containing protein [Brevibacillus ruminantium]|uniref:DUF402 domain-containing protein n=1 Tax=Brevibacillus ruminantium TaxID=2950604 RepID=A0ABY4WKS3_9BACL|nr:DUF402 domain-containing protein [Brevibacillus ruminantium]USG66662.1 DUF402 domain-containing protein [Brevibacillus ruminantium]
MKRKRADRPNWRRVKKLGYDEKWLETAQFTGYAVRLTLDDVIEPAYMPVGEKRLCVGDQDYCYLQFFPSGCGYAVTKMLNERGETIQWYIDICKEHGKDQEGHLYYDDLYLDIVVLPNGEVYLLDQDELDEALQRKLINRQEYQFACQTAAELLKRYEAGDREWFDFPDPWK